MQRRDAMENASEAVWDVIEPTAAFHTKRTQRTSHETRTKDIMARQDSLQAIPCVAQVRSSRDGSPMRKEMWQLSVLDLRIRHV